MEKKKNKYVLLNGGRKLKAGKFVDPDDNTRVSNYVLQKSFIKNDKWNNEQRISIFPNEVTDAKACISSIMNDYLSFEELKVLKEKKDE